MRRMRAPIPPCLCSIGDLPDVARGGRRRPAQGLSGPIVCERHPFACCRLPILVFAVGEDDPTVRRHVIKPELRKAVGALHYLALQPSWSMLARTSPYQGSIIIWPTWGRSSIPLDSLDLSEQGERLLVDPERLRPDRGVDRRRRRLRGPEVVVVVERPRRARGRRGRAVCGFERPAGRNPSRDHNLHRHRGDPSVGRAAPRPPPLRRYLDIRTAPVSHPPGWVGTFLPHPRTS